MKSIAEVETAVNQELQVGNSKFVILEEIEWPSTGGVDMDALPTKPVSVPLSSIREIRPAKTWKTWDNIVELLTTSNRIAVRGTIEEIVKKLNAPDKETRKPFAPFALTPREARIQGMRVSGCSLNEIAVALSAKSSLRIAMDLSTIDKKLEAAAARTGGTGKYLIPASEGTLAMMRDRHMHPDATI